MAYTSGVFFLDLENGSDSARAALTTVIVSDNGSGGIRCNKTAHGLTTGAIVTTTLYNGALAGTNMWKITRIDADNFDLDTAVWNVNITDTSGTATPKGGSSKADAFRTLPVAMAAGSTVLGDTVRLMASPDPTSLGQNATFTEGSDTVTLTSAVTANIDACESAWTASANVTATAQSTTQREGTNAASLAIAAGFTTGLIAYKALGGATDFSAYQQVSFMMRANGAVTSGWFELKLCSDAVGAVPVNTIVIPAFSANYWLPIVIDTGAALGNSIQSVALYATADPGTITVFLDNIIACKASSAADSLTHNSLIGKGTGGTEPWMAIDSINGTTIKLGGAYQSRASRSGCKPYYYGATATQTIYKRESISISASITPSGGSTGDLRIAIECGWDRTAMTSQSGLTMVRATPALASSSSASAFGGDTASFGYLNKFYAVGFGARYAMIFNEGWTLGEVGAIACYRGLVNSQAFNLNAEDASVRNFIHCDCVFLPVNTGNATRGVRLRLDKVWGFNGDGTLGSTLGLAPVIDANYTFHVLNKIVIADAEIKGWYAVYAGEFTSLSHVSEATFKNCTIDDCLYDVFGSPVSALFHGCTSTAAYYTSTAAIVTYLNVGGDATSHKFYFPPFQGNCVIYSDTSTRHTASDFAWRIEPSNSAAGDYQLAPKIPVAQIACIANVAHTIKVWVRRANTALRTRLFIDGGFTDGLLDDTYSTEAAAAINTWEQLSLTFTPTQDAVVTVCVQSWGHATAYTWFDDVTVDDVDHLGALNYPDALGVFNNYIAGAADASSMTFLQIDGTIFYGEAGSGGDAGAVYAVVFVAM